MTVREILKKYSNSETELLLTQVLKKSKEFLYLNPEYNLTKKQFSNLTKLIRRRKKGEPIAYILGYKDFYGLRLKVNKYVLIPRPETEGLLDAVIAVASEAILTSKRLPRSDAFARNDKFSILDIGTGSGCIAIAIVKQLQKFQISNFKFQITASDISEKALEVAKANAKTHKVKVKFIKSDLLENIEFNPDIIIANLPYGWLGVKNRFSSVKDGLKFEPELALFTKEKGLYLYRMLLEQIALRNQKPKLVYLEFDPRQKKDLEKLIQKTLPGTKSIFYKDLRGLWRFVEVDFE